MASEKKPATNQPPPGMMTTKKPKTHRVWLTTWNQQEYDKTESIKWQPGTTTVDTMTQLKTGHACLNTHPEINGAFKKMTSFYYPGSLKHDYHNKQYYNL